MYAIRNDANAIVTLLAHPADGAEFVPDDDPEVIAFLAPKVPDPGTVLPRLQAAAFEVTVENFDITAMNGVFNLVSAAYLDVGQFMLFFLTPMPDTDYWVEFGGGAPYMTVQLKDPTCVIIQAQDAVGGAFVDPASFSVKIYRID